MAYKLIDKLNTELPKRSFKYFSLEFIAHEPRKRIDRTTVSIAPHNCHCIVAFLHHVGWIHVLRYLINFEKLPAVNFVDAASAFTLKSQLVGVYLAGYFASISQVNHAILGLETCLPIIGPQCIYLLVHQGSNILVQLHHWHAFGQSNCKGGASVAHLRDFLYDWHFKRIFNAKLLNQLLSIAGAKYPVLFVALAALVVSHIFNYGNGGHFKLVKHFNSLDYVHVGKLLWCGNYYCRLQSKLLQDRELDIASSWRKVHHQIVEIAPIGTANKLGHDVASHGTAHNSTFVAGCISK